MDLTFHFLAAFLSLLVLYAGFLPLVLIHEAGHFLAGRACGFRLARFRIGPAELVMPNVFKPEDRPKWKWHWRWRSLWSGSIGMRAKNDAQTRMLLRYLVYLAGGPLGNLGAALLALPVALHQSTLGGIGKYFIVGSVLFGVGNLVPLKRLGVESDGYVLWSLLFVTKRREARLYWISYVARLEEIVGLFKDNQAEGALIKARALICSGERLAEGSMNSDQRRVFLMMKAKFGEARLNLSSQPSRTNEGQQQVS
jgi:hypothetical protein